MDVYDYYSSGLDDIKNHDYIQANEKFMKAAEMIFSPSKIAGIREANKDLAPDVRAFVSMKGLGEALGLTE